MKILIEQIVKLSNKNKEGHIASSLSVLDILYILYKNFIPYKTKKILAIVLF